MKLRNLFIFALFLFHIQGFSQNYPWNNPLRMAWSQDGITFDTPSIFQDSAGVPSIIRWKGDTLIAAFQWFRQPNPSPSWDRVAVKFSYNNGINWTEPTPIIINNFPSNYQRPFDPTLAILGNDNIRIYFSSSEGVMMGGLDSTVNTYSAVSTDGIHYNFEPNPRVDVGNNRVIDPAVIYFNNSWHYISPIGAPQAGAYHYVSPDGLIFLSVPIIPSNFSHNWTGNYMVENASELRFYGSGQNIWYNSSPNGGVWNGYINTNIIGGDPSVVKISDGNYLMVYVGQPYNTSIGNNTNEKKVSLSPSPASDFLRLTITPDLVGATFLIMSVEGKPIKEGTIFNLNTILNINDLASGIYYLKVKKEEIQTFKIVKE
jgi:hypothetical protein